MKRKLQKILFVFALLFASCANANKTQTSEPKMHEEKIEDEAEVYLARVTYYSADPKWGNRVACQAAKFAKEGVSVAAHPDFKFGTKLSIPALKNIIGDGEFIVQDRGPAVTKKLAAKGNRYVFDVYVSSHEKIENLKTAVPDYVQVIVHR